MESKPDKYYNVNACFHIWFKNTERSQYVDDDKEIKIVSGCGARKLAALPGTGMSKDQAQALEEERNAANL